MVFDIPFLVFALLKLFYGKGHPFFIRPAVAGARYFVSNDKVPGTLSAMTKQ